MEAISESDLNLSEELTKIKLAAARIASLSLTSYKAGEPAKYEEMRKFFNKGFLELAVVVRLTPRLQVEVAMEGGGERFVFANLVIHESGAGSAPLIN